MTIFDFDLMTDSGAPSWYNRFSREKSMKGKKTSSIIMGSTFKRRKYQDFSYVNTTKYRKYRNDYIRFLKENEKNINFYTNLDVINNPELTLQNQKILESNGLHPIPVFHVGPNCNYQYLKNYLNKYDYIALGGLIPNSTSQLKPILDPLFKEFIYDKDGFPKVKVHGFACTSPTLMMAYPWACMTEDHTVLTKRGWLGRKEIKKGDYVLTLKNGISEWKPVLKVYTYDVKNTPIRRYKGKFSSATTYNHNWPIYGFFGKEQKRVWKWKKTTEFTYHDQIPRSAKHINFPTNKTYSDELVKLIAWVFTNGTITLSERMKKLGYKSPNVIIYQCERKHPQYVKEIRNLLKKENATWSESINPQLEGGRTVCFYISRLLKEKISNILGCPKFLSFEFILSLTEDQLNLFIKELLKGDGIYIPKKRGKNTFEFTQSEGKGIEAFKLACILAGIPFSSFKINAKEKNPKWSNQEVVTSSNITNYTPRNSIYQDINYTGKVWCIEVENHTFFTNCDGSYYWTGNSCDSTTARKLAMFGHVYVPALDTLGVIQVTTISNRPIVNPSPKEAFFPDIPTVPKNEQLKVKNRVKKRIIEYSEKIGCSWEELCSDYMQRMIFNHMYFSDFVKQEIPKWPWRWNEKKREAAPNAIEDFSLYIAGSFSKKEEVWFWNELAKRPGTSHAIKKRLHSFFYEKQVAYCIKLKTEEEEEIIFNRKQDITFKRAPQFKRT